MVDAYTLKTEALCWLRFSKQLPYIATEVVFHRNEDVLGMNEEYSVEVEVKVSLQDLKREFKTKEGKHYLYNNAAPGLSVPNFFYFYLPQELEEKAVEIVAAEAPKAGVAIYDGARGRDGKRTRIARRATRLHEGKPSRTVIKTLIARMGSELCLRHVLQRKIREEIIQKFDMLNDQIVNSAKEIPNTTDWEKE
jgi:hypothetical protein